MTGNRRENGDSDIRPHYYRAEIDNALLLVRSLLILHSGALVTILISITRSEDVRLISVLANACSYFWFGLAAALFGMISFSPAASDLGGINRFA